MWTELKENDFPFNGFNANDEELMEFDLEQSEIFNDFKERACVELQRHSNQRFVRDDYKEITRLSLKFLTGLREKLTKPNQSQFNALQNPSNARFMATAIQGLNCFLFREHLDWDSVQRENIRQQLPRFGMFLSLLYVRYWNISSILFDAPINDLNFLKELEEYVTIDNEISTVAIRAISRHLHYISEELAVLSIFSEKLSFCEKNEIAAKLLQIDDELPERDIDNENVDDWRTKRIVDFIGDRSLHLFHLFDIALDFLGISADQWITSAEYLNAQNKIEKVQKRRIVPTKYVSMLHGLEWERVFENNSIRILHFYRFK